MNLKTKSAILALGALAVAGFTFWPGCAWPPLPSTHHTISNLQPRDFKFERGAHPTREEIFARLGKPDEYFPDLDIACYKLERLTRDRVVLLFFILPVYGYKDVDRLKVAFLQFDERGQLKRGELKVVPEPRYPNQMRNLAQQWSREQPAANQRKR